jgi:hypothetical protein
MEDSQYHAKEAAATIAPNHSYGTHRLLLNEVFFLFFYQLIVLKIFQQQTLPN